MFDIGFSELIVIGVVALIVIGPERLPSVARTMGHLLGRLQRYVSDVKADVQREMHLEEIKKIRAEVEDQARGIERTVVGEMQAIEGGIKNEAKSLSELMNETGNEVARVAESTLSDFDPAKDVPPQTLPPPAALAAAETTPVADAVAIGVETDRRVGT